MLHLAAGFEELFSDTQSGKNHNGGLGLLVQLMAVESELFVHEPGNPLHILHFIGGYPQWILLTDRKSTRLNSSHVAISYAVFCLKKKNTNNERKKKIEDQRTYN